MIGVSDARVIRTPDQRLRVFVSSTLRELAPERRAARGSIERLHLAPVMFELGARPHPPRELYRAYLEQSDVFVGIYWQQYGWIAPDEEISGLEDEYRLAPREMPKLIYVKQPAEREERLADLIARIRDDDTASYKPFSTAEELAELVDADLATLLAERFDASRAQPATVGATAGRRRRRARRGRPHPRAARRTPLGRETRSRRCSTGSAGTTKRLVTLVGPGGIGKTRLAIEVARLAQDRFDRVTFVRLADVRDARRRAADDRAATSACATRATVPLDRADSGRARAGRRDLIVLDNFEQVLAGRRGCPRPADARSPARRSS